MTYSNALHVCSCLLATSPQRLHIRTRTHRSSGYVQSPVCPATRQYVLPSQPAVGGGAASAGGSGPGGLMTRAGRSNVVGICSSLGAVLGLVDTDPIACVAHSLSQDDGTTATGASAWFKTACLTEPGPGTRGSACLPMTTRSARADRPTSARPVWPCTTSWLTGTSG